MIPKHPGSKIPIYNSFSKGKFEDASNMYIYTQFSSSIGLTKVQVHNSYPRNFLSWNKAGKSTKIWQSEKMQMFQTDRIKQIYIYHMYRYIYISICPFPTGNCVHDFHPRFRAWFHQMYGGFPCPKDTAWSCKMMRSILQDLNRGFPVEFCETVQFNLYTLSTKYIYCFIHLYNHNLPCYDSKTTPSLKLPLTVGDSVWETHVFPRSLMDVSSLSRRGTWKQSPLSGA